MIHSTPEQSYGQPAIRSADAASILRCLQQSKLFRDYQHAFETTTGFPFVLRAAGSFQAPLAESTRANPFCTLMRQANQTCSACLQFQQRTEDAAVTQSKTLQCYAGLSESMVPVRVGDQVLGYLQTGQVFLVAPSARRLETILCTPSASVWDRRKLEFAYYQTRIVDPEQYRAIIQLLVLFAEHLATVSNQLLTSRAMLESPSVTKIRTYIAKHQEQVLGLEDVARIVNMSPCHFCRFFKRATGFTFTEYLARVRVESVKQRLQNVHVRITEAAFAAGFQSLSQFNRVFRRIVGESPTGYRARLPGLTLKPAAAR